MTEEEYQKLYKALYILNKSAKKSRDTANSTSNKGIALRCRNRKNSIYKLKHAVMDKLLQEGKLTFLGIHFQEINEGKGFYLAYFESPEGFSYHRPATKSEINAVKNNSLELMTIVPSIVKRKGILISFTEAFNLCLKYLGISKKEISKLKKNSILTEKIKVPNISTS